MYDEGVSDDYRVEISWDGIWEDGPEYTHLEIKPVLD